jgi:hypothetical protein
MLTLVLAPKNNADEISEKHRMKIRDTFTYRNGIAVDDPPIDSVEEMLADMTKRVLQEGFQKFIDRLAGTPLKYASMCSGADTGKIALDQAIKCKSMPRNLQLHACLTNS